MNSFRLFQLAKKLLFCARFLSFFRSVAQLCNSKKPSNEHKIANFRYNSTWLVKTNNQTSKSRASNTTL